MKKIPREITPTIIILSAFAFYLLNCGGYLQAAHQNQQKDPEYAPGQLVIKLKQGRNLDDIQELNLNYNVRTSEKVFKDTPSPEETLKEMKETLGKLDTSHESWYWQLDKNSQEYKDYAAKIKQEKDDLARQIEAQEKLIAKLEQRQKRAPADAQTPGLDNIYLLNSDSGTNIPAMEAEYSANDAVEYAEPNYVVKAMMSPTDPYYSSSGSWGQSYDDLWGLKKIQVEKAWDISQGEGVVVAVVDSGIDYTHEDIADNIWKNSAETAGNGVDDDGNGYVDDVKGYDFANSDSDPMDDHGHGTHVAGTIAASGNNSKGIIGVAYKAKVMAIKGLDKKGSGYDSNLAQALRYAADKGADIINNSWGGAGNSSTIEEAINYAYSKGCVIIAAAGNSNDDASGFHPAGLNNVITVASTDHNDTKSDFSNYGVKIDVSAPGGDSEDSNDTAQRFRNILSLRSQDTDLSKDGRGIVGNNYYRARGTSMAAPHASAVAALVIAKNSAFTNEEIRQIIRRSSDDIDNSGFDINTGHGRINAYNALQIDSVCIAKIISPGSNTLHTGSIEIEGTASGSDFQSYTLEYAESITGAWAKIDSSNYSQVSNNILGAFTPSKTGQYYIKLTVTDKNNNTYQDIAGKIFVDKDINQGWPQKTGGINFLLSSPFIAADIDNDNKKEIIAGTAYGEVYIFRHNGDALSGWPIKIKNSVIYDISLADIDSNGDLEIFFVASNYLYGYHHDGTAIDGWPKMISAVNWGSYTLTIGDMDNNGSYDILAIPAMGLEYNIASPRSIYIFKNDGSILSEWDLSKKINAKIPFGSGHAIGDIDKDGMLEVFIPIASLDDENQYLYILDYKGNILKSLKLEGVTYSSASSNPVDTNRPILGDMDKDGDMDIVLSRSCNGEKNFKCKLFIWSYDNGNYSSILTMETDDSVARQLSLADINGDNDLEIVYAKEMQINGINGDSIIAINQDGSQSWTSGYQQASAFYGSSVICTIDNKKYIASLDSIGNTKKDYMSLKIYAADNSIALEHKIPKATYQHYSVPIIEDLDGDGKAEIAVLHPDNGSIAVWTIYGKYDKEEKDWPMFQHDIYRSGNYDFNPKTADTTAPEGSILLVSNSSGYTKTAQINLSLSASDDTGVAGYYLSENNSAPSANASGWITVTSTASYSADVSYTLSSGDGTKNVYCWYKDAAGNISEQYKTSAILDTTAPAIAITNPTASSTYSTSSSNLNLGGTASDATSGVKEITWKSDKGGSGAARGTTSWSVSNISLSKGKNIIMVTAKDNAGNEKSTTLNVTYTAAAAPSKPSNLSAYAISTQTVKLIWKDNSNNETGFRIERKAKNSQYNEISVVSANIAVYNDSGLKTHTKYTYRVRAYNNTGSSSYSNIATTTTKKQRLRK